MACDYSVILSYNEQLRQDLRALTLSDQLTAFYAVVATLIEKVAPGTPTDPAILLKEWRCLRCYGQEDLLVAIGAMLCTPTGSLNPPLIVSNPLDVIVEEGADWTMFVVAAGSAPLNYQWRFNGISIDGARVSIFSMQNTPMEAAGLYDVIVTNPVGSVQSLPGRLTVLKKTRPPLIVSHPTNLTVYIGEPAAFSVTASGSPEITYQWRFNGTAIAGRTQPVLVIPVSNLSDAGQYDVVATNPYGTATSNPATLTVLTRPVFPVYLGSAGPNAPASYTGAQLKALGQIAPYANPVNVTRVPGTYEISITPSGQNEWRVMAFPTDKVTQPPIFKSSGFPLPMNLVQTDCNVDGVLYSVYRTQTRSPGPFTIAAGSQIEVT